jgi:hypothetical protein
METTQGIFLYSYLHLKLAKPLWFFFLSFMLFSSTKSENKRVEQERKGERGGDPNNVYTCK